MDFTGIAAGVITALVPYLAKGGEKLVDKMVDEGFEQRGKIWEKTKGLFLDDNLTLLNLFEENPNDAKTQGKLESKLEDKLQANLEIAKEFESLLKQIPAEMKTNSMNIQGNANKVAQDIKDSTITIS
ncbi:MAG: hypothetical protein H0W77_11285 [Acidobacteria bacterium]|jgi:hypothetical protein|nr:hypothetical protein [Acidobacteriota bacterium]